MAANPDLPPAYNTLNVSSAVIATEPAVVVANKCDNDAESEFASCFEDKKVRIRFVQKVLGIKLLQLLAETVLMLIFTTSYHNLFWAIRRDHANFIVVSALAYLVTLGFSVYCKEVRWKTPYKYIFLAANPLTFGSLVSVTLFFCGLAPVVTAWIYFCMVIFALLLYSSFAYRCTKIDFTVKTGLYITMGVLVAAYAFSVPFIWVNSFAILYCTLVVFLLCSYILKDLEAMVSKGYRFVVTPADFVNGALILHIDYWYIFSTFCNKYMCTIN